jgi:hypothetical protein
MEVHTSGNGGAAALGGPIATASFVGGVAGALALSDVPYPRPGSSPDQIRKYFSDNAWSARISIAGQLISAAALGVFAVSVFKLAPERPRIGRHSSGCARRWHREREYARHFGIDQRRTHKGRGRSAR